MFAPRSHDAVEALEAFRVKPPRDRDVARKAIVVILADTGERYITTGLSRTKDWPGADMLAPRARAMRLAVDRGFGR
jgi:hypothetical protein